MEKIVRNVFLWFEIFAVNGMFVLAERLNRSETLYMPVLLVQVSWKGTPKFVTAHNFTISVLLLFVNSANIMLP